MTTIAGLNIVENAFALALQFTLYMTIYLITSEQLRLMPLLLDHISILRRSKDAPSGVHLRVKTSRSNLSHKSRHTSTCCLGKQERPALFGRAQFLLDGGESERR